MITPEILKQNGFTVIMPTNHKGWYWTEKNGVFLSFDIKTGTISTCHIPNKESGTGFRIHDGGEISVHEIPLIKVPNWWRGEIPKLYSSVQEFIESQKWCKPYIL